MIDFRIDYIQFSSNLRVIASVEGWDSVAQKSNMRFYDRMTTYENGLRVYTGNPNTEKRLFVVDGKTCERLKINHETCDKIVNEWDSTVSRIDLALTTDKEILKKIMRDKGKIESKLWNDIKVLADGELSLETIYIGNMKDRGRKGIVRCYDKAVQLGLEAGIIMQRIEIELKQKHAQTATRRLATGKSIQSVMNAKFKIDAKWYRDIFSDDIALGRFVIHKESGLTDIQRKMLWLMKQVVPSMAYVVEYDVQNGTKNFELLMQEIEKKLLLNVD